MTEQNVRREIGNHLKAALMDLGAARYDAMFAELRACLKFEEELLECEQSNANVGLMEEKQGEEL